MQSLSWLSGNRALEYGAIAVMLIVAALLVLLIFRLAFGRRLRMSGGRGRQLRLGIVDAFDLDRQRQLVIVRRDNVEHLIMIGGPNDILIESQIVRAEAREPRQRDKDREKPRDKDMEPMQLPAAQPLKPTSVEPQLPLPPFVPEAPAEEPVTARQIPSVTQTVVTPASPAPAQPVVRAPLATPVGPRRTSPVRPDVKPAPAPFPPAPAVSTPATPAPATPAPAATSPVATPPSAPEPVLPGIEAALPAKPAPSPVSKEQTAAAQGFMRWRPNQNPAQPQARPPGPSFTQPIRPRDPSQAAPAPLPAAVETKPTPELEPALAVPPVPPKDEVATAPAPSGPEDLMVSLEEEMAKLLGRAPDKP